MASAQGLLSDGVHGQTDTCKTVAQALPKRKSRCEKSTGRHLFKGGLIKVDQRNQKKRDSQEKALVLASVISDVIKI